MRFYLLLPFLFIVSGCEQFELENPTTDSIRTARGFLNSSETKDRAELKQFLGVDPVRYEWCAAFVNSVLEVNNIPGSESVSEHPLMARSFLRWGEKVSEPKRGDIIVFPRGNSDWQGHVGFYISTYSVTGIEYYVILGGNQDDKVSYELYPSARALSIRRPLAQ